MPDRKSKKSREELLAEVARLPALAFVPAAHAAAYLDSTADVLLNWRSQRRGPRYYGNGNFIRYRISDLDLWMSSRADEVRVDEPAIENSGPSTSEQAIVATGERA
jgi:hypothetical protein